MNEIEGMRDNALTSRVAEANDKGFKEFKKSLDTAVTELQNEVVTEKLELFDMRSDNGATNFFTSASRLIAAAKKRG